MKPLQPTLPLRSKAKTKFPSILRFENEAREKGFYQVAGVDEAGRGPLAGPVTAAACVISEDTDISGLDDSKKLTPTKRRELYQRLVCDPSVQWKVAVVEAEVIDEINILQATMRAMLEAVEALDPPADCLLVDGLHLPHPTLPCCKIIKGDQLSASIMAAAIIAKETRDRLMVQYDALYPEYGFAGHKGYGTAKHRAAIMEHGPCPIHRRSFEPIKSLV